MNRRALALFSLVAAFYLGACAAYGPRMVPVPCDERLEALFPPSTDTAGIELIGRVRLELPRYRIRGLCRILASPGGMLRIDFRHSSLFGAVSGDVTIIAGDSLAILDREEGRAIGADSSLALLRESVGADLDPDDLLYALLLAVPRCAEMGAPAVEESESRWKVKALWRGRTVELEGKRGEGPRQFRQCFAGDERCLVASYDRYDPKSPLRYPGRIRLSRMGGSERITLELIDIKHVMTSSEMFSIDDAGFDY